MHQQAVRATVWPLLKLLVQLVRLRTGLVLVVDLRLGFRRG